MAPHQMLVDRGEREIFSELSVHTAHCSSCASDRFDMKVYKKFVHKLLFSHSEYLIKLLPLLILTK